MRSPRRGYFHASERAVRRSPMIPGSRSTRSAARPGVRSKRWSGRTDLTGQALDDENNRLLLEKLATSTSDRARALRVRGRVRRRRRGVACVAARCTGAIIDAAARGTDGFGYDPYFCRRRAGHDLRRGERAAKERVSHRGRAFAHCSIALAVDAHCDARSRAS